MYARSVLITGSSRGLGLELVRQLVPHVEIIIATCRDPENAKDLRQLSENHPNIKILTLDVLKHESFDAVARQVSALVGNSGLNVLINNAAIAPEAARTDSFSTLEMAETYAVNVISPTKLIKAMLPLLKEAGENASQGFHVKNALVVNMSSDLGSMSDPQIEAMGGLFLPYRCSKAALNMVSKCLSCELKKDNITVVSMHPGWVQTDMGGPNAHLKKDESIRLFIETLETINPEHTGQYITWDGKRLPW